MRAVDLTDQRFGCLVALRSTHLNGGTAWVVRCDCGVEKVVSTNSLRCSRVRSCGHLRGVANRRRLTTHGGRHTPEYKAWCDLKARCENPNTPNFNNYGGRGIRVCEEWRASFEAFLAHVGPRPSPKHSIDRKDNDGSYEPGNVRWVTPKQQARNKRTSRLIELDGERLRLGDWAGRTGIKRLTLFMRIKRGWSIEKALTTPVRGN